MGCGASSAKNVEKDGKGKVKKGKKEKKGGKEKKDDVGKKGKKKGEEKKEKTEKKEKKKKKVEEEKPVKIEPPKKKEEKKKKGDDGEKKKKEEEEAKRKKEEEERKKKEAAKKKKKEEEKAAAAKKMKEEEEADAAKKKKEEEEAAAAKKKKEEEEAAAAKKKKEEEEAAAAKKKKEEEAAEAERKRKEEEEAGRYHPPKVPEINPFVFPKANYDLDKLEDFVFKFPYFHTLPKLQNIYLFDYDDRNPKKDLLVQDQWVKEDEAKKITFLSGQKLDRDEYSFCYDVKDTPKFAKIENDTKLFPGIKNFVVFPVCSDDHNLVYRLIVCALDEINAEEEEELQKRLDDLDKPFLERILPFYSQAYLTSDIRGKFQNLANQLVQWLNYKTSKDRIHVGFFYNEPEEDEKTKKKLHNICWVSGVPENPLYDDGEEDIGKIVPSLLKKKGKAREGKKQKAAPIVAKEKYRMWLIDTKVTIFSERFYGILKIHCEDMTHEIEDVVEEAIRVFRRVLRWIKDNEEEAEILEDQNVEDDDEKDEGARSSQEEGEDGEVSEDEESKVEKEDDEIGLFFRTFINKSLRKIRKLTRAEFAELISFSDPPKGVHSVVKSILYLLGLSRKSVKNWDRCRSIMKTKSKGRFKALNDLDINKVKPVIRNRIRRGMRTMTHAEAMEINIPVARLYIFLEVCVASWAAKEHKMMNAEFKDIYGHHLKIEYPKKKEEEEEEGEDDS